MPLQFNQIQLFSVNTRLMVMAPVKQLLIARLAFVTITMGFPVMSHALSPAEVFEIVKDSVFVVESFDIQGKRKSMGSGVLLPTGKVSTNCHVLAGAERYKVGRAGQFVSATLYAGNEDKDICLLDIGKLDGKPVKVGKSAGLRVGAQVYAVGAPQGLELTFSDGIVSQLRGAPAPIIQTTAAISPGSSGGGLFDSEGQLVGLTTLYVEGGQSLNFAIPVEWLHEIEPGNKFPPNKLSMERWLIRAIALEIREDWNGLLSWCQRWVNPEPKNDWVRYFSASAYAGLRRHTEAVREYRYFLNLYPKAGFAWYGLGNSYYHLNFYNEAIAAFREALLIDTQFADAWNNLGLAYSSAGRLVEAIDAYHQALKYDANDGKAWNNLGLTYVELKKYAEASDVFRQALLRSPANPARWTNLGSVYALMNRYPDAIEAYREALKLDPELASAWYGLGNVYGSVNRYLDAANAFKQAVRINPSYKEAWMNLGYTYVRLGDRVAAMQVVQVLQGLDRSKADLLFNLVAPK